MFQLLPSRSITAFALALALSIPVALARPSDWVSNDGNDPLTPGCTARFATEEACPWDQSQIIARVLETCSTIAGNETLWESWTANEAGGGGECASYSCCPYSHQTPIDCVQWCKQSYGDHYNGRCEEQPMDCFGTQFNLGGYCECYYRPEY